VLLNLSPGALVNGLGGALLIVLATWMMLVSPRRATTTLLAGFIGTFGAWTLELYIINDADPGAAAFEVAFSVLNVASAACLGGLALRWPTRLAEQERPFLLAAATAGVGVAGVALAGAFLHGESWALLRGYPPERLALARLAMVSVAPFYGAMSGSLVLLALRFGAASNRALQNQLALMAATLFVWAGPAGGLILVTRVAFLATLGASLAVGVGLSSLLWLSNTRSAPSRAARNVALFALALFLCGMALGVALNGFEGAAQAGVFGVFRAMAMTLLAFSILRHQLLGIDVKVKWTIKRGTLAGMFLAVFFVVAQLGQNYLSGALGWAVGGVAAGLMLFALTPLQRLAERVADAAMPGVKAVGEMTRDDRASLYREAARTAWADGVLTRDERAMLDTLRDRLGLGGDESIRIEREAAGAG
jgi:hypothetical protein